MNELQIFKMVYQSMDSEKSNRKGVRKMWVPKWHWEYASTKQNELERRVKRLELILLKDAENKIASLSDEEAGTRYKDGILTIEKVINRKIGK